MNLYYLASQLIDPTQDNIPQVSANDTTMQKVLSLVFITIGAVSLLMLVIAGLRYVVSAGDVNKTAETRRMIIYTVVGVIVSASAYIIVNTVIGKVQQ